MSKVFIEVTETRAISSDRDNWMLMRRSKKRDKVTGDAVGGYSEWTSYKYPTELGHAAVMLEKELIRTCGAQTFTELHRMANHIHDLFKETFDLAESYKKPIK